jgi:hypothetical protein
MIIVSRARRRAPFREVPCTRFSRLDVPTRPANLRRPLAMPRDNVFLAKNRQQKLSVGQKS